MTPSNAAPSRYASTPGRWVASWCGVALLLLCCGCATKVHVSSDTWWEGQINGGHVQGRGNRTFEWVKQEGYKPCAYFTKLTAEGYLEARVEQRFQTDTRRRTDEPYGTVSACVK